MPAGRPPGGPIVPVASQVLDGNGRMMPEYTQFLRELADFGRDINALAAQIASVAASALTLDPSGNLIVPGGLSLESGTTPAYPLDLRDGAGSQVHIASTASDDGTYILSTILFGAPATYISCGCAWDGSVWIAKNTSASILAITPGSFLLAYNSSLIVGGVFTPLTAFEVDYSSGTITFPSMRTTNPGAGAKQLWADPTDSYRVKFAF